MDTFAEQLVKKNLSSAEKFKRNMILAGSVILGGIAVALSAVLSYYYLFTGIVICAALIAGGFWFSKNTEVEYEYSVTNGELDIDKIIAKRKRKPLLSVNASDFSEKEKSLILSYRAHPEMQDAIQKLLDINNTN